MSMNPGATTWPAASMTRAASPESFGATATIRSPSTATSAARAGAPEPSISDPFRTRRDQATDYSSVIVTAVILSPCLMRSTCSMPDTTRPKTVYWPSRCCVAP